MAGHKSPRIPKYAHHKASGRARVIIDGRHIYLGKYGSPESKRKYQKLVGKWLAGSLEKPANRPEVPVTIVELLVHYLNFADSYYRKDGKRTREYGCTKEALSFLRSRFELIPADDFGPRALMLVREEMVAYGWCRKHINKQISRVVRMFKWAVAQEFCRPETYSALCAVQGLRKGRTTAPETAPVTPVRDEVVNATLPELGPIVSDMVRVQRFLGCRPSEVCQLRPGAIERTDDVWKYRPDSHKMEHAGRDRIIYVGPKAQAILMRYLLRPEGAYCFSPKESPGARSNASTQYTKDSYGRAIRRAVHRVNSRRQSLSTNPDLLELWSPNRLRHSRATEIRRDFGLEASQVLLGHASADVTQIYAERDEELAAKVARQTG